jgi:hypothetical protein
MKPVPDHWIEQNKNERKSINNEIKRSQKHKSKEISRPPILLHAPNSNRVMFFPLATGMMSPGFGQVVVCPPFIWPGHPPPGPLVELQRVGGDPCE